MKLAIIYDAFYPEVIGGAERRNWEVACRLARRGHDVWLLSMQHWDGPSVIERDGVHCAGVCPAVPLFSKHGRRSFTEPFYFAWHLFRYLRKQRFDLLELGNFPYLSCLAAKFAVWRNRTPLVIMWHETRGLRGWVEYAGIAGLIAFIFEILTTWLTPFNTVNSPLTYRRTCRIYPKLARKTILIPCGVDFAGPEESEINAVRRFNLLSVGRLVPHKRINWALDAIGELRQEFPAINLTIIGSGPCEQALRDKAVELGIADIVTFSGFVSADELTAAKKRSGIFLLPSEQEGFGMVMMEAMAAGLPVVAAQAELSAAGDILTHNETGLVAETKDEFINGVRNLLSDDNLFGRIADAGQTLAKTYDWDSNIIPQLEAYFRNQVFSTEQLEA